MMPDSANEGWQELQVPSRKQCPKLFYSFTTQDESLTLLVTDLISIWECYLDKYDILSHAARQHASIDPSVSSDQFDILLSKIGKSLKDGDNVLLRQDLRNSQLLLLKTKTDLPKPLRPLEWTFKLTPRDASELAERILRPSLHEVAVSGEKVKSLLRTIKEKDHVISRLLDRVGNSSIDLGLIFPGITGMASRKGGQVSITDAKKHVPGMAGFDEKAWTKQFANDEGYEGADRTGLSNLVRGNEKCFAHTKSEHEDWIKELSTTDKVDPGPGKSNSEQSKPSTRESKRRQPSPDNEATDSDNDFEVSSQDRLTGHHLNHLTAPTYTARLAAQIAFQE
ncbi:XRCC4-like factor-domain-containing protein [Exophiala viscosa]|uniref:Non-homologous end-joining factor 1 n=1 Tax=Exophiala viscosa TaxID=2486360 RepID=A0AAN6I9S3_9EURO|nr:XRCC4-like factor-domain-containing protein [Exophiala viscosa]